MLHSPHPSPPGPSRRPKRWSPVSGAGRRGAVAILLALSLPACAFRKEFPPQPVVAEVELQGATSVETSPILAGLATTESQRFLGIWDGVAFEYEVYDPELLSKDLLRVERYLRRKGYYEAKVVAARVIALDEHRVRIEIRVLEGAPVITTSVTPRGLEALPIDVSTEALRGNVLRPGKPFDEDAYTRSKQRITDVLRDSGYAFAKVQGKVTVDIASHSAQVEYDVIPGVVAHYGAISVEGLDEVPESIVRDNLALTTGERFSQEELIDARKALSNLNVFTSVAVIAQTDEAQGNVVPIKISVDETDLRTLRAGAGMQIDSLQLSNHLTLGWEDKNFLGGLRRFDIDAKPGLVYYPTRFGNLVTPTRGLYQQQIRAQLRQPSLFEGRTSGILSSSFSVYPLLYADSGPDDEVIGFSEVKASAAAERAFFRHRVVVSPSYNWQLAMPVDYQKLTIGPGVPSRDDLLQNLIIAYPELAVSLDLRDDRFDPHEGVLLSASLQMASPIFGSDVSDYRVLPEARFYVPISKRVTFASRFTTGFLFADNYGQTLQATEADIPDRELAQDQQKLLFRGFFSGGPNSNRGYTLRGVGPHGDVRFLSRNVDCTANPTVRDCNRPLGGVSLWEASGEVRFVVLGPLGGVLFVDGSDVLREVGLDFSAPHLSVGSGLRYATPIGPVRFDAGYRLPFAQDFNQQAAEGNPPTLFGLPIALHLTLGEAF